MNQSRFIIYLLPQHAGSKLTVHSNFMRVLVLSMKNSMEGYLSPPSALFEQIGNLTFLQLSTLRHRGAFSTVSQTFATCCQHVRYLKDSDPGSGASLLEIWYQVRFFISLLELPCANSSPRPFQGRFTDLALLGGHGHYICSSFNDTEIRWYSFLNNWCTIFQCRESIF
jgi:hypothetical protein